MASQKDPDTQLDKHWAFVKPTESDDNLSIASTLYYHDRKKFSRTTIVRYHKTYYGAESKTLIIEVRTN